MLGWGWARWVGMLSSMVNGDSELHAYHEAKVEPHHYHTSTGGAGPPRLARVQKESLQPVDCGKLITQRQLGC